jgi:hypothetical protein
MVKPTDRSQPPDAPSGSKPTEEIRIGLKPAAGTEEPADAVDPVEEAGRESFPASDPPAWSEAARGLRPPRE